MLDLTMEKGINTDIHVNGTKFHIQTEDWGPLYRLVVSQVFCQGAILKSVKNTYESFQIKGPKSDPQSIRLAIKEQHHQILDQLISGQL